MKTFSLIILTMLFLSYPQINKMEKPSDFDAERFNQRLDEVKEVVASRSDYNKEVAFFIDMKVKSGKYRFFVYDLINNKIIDHGLVAHGSGSETGIAGDLKFSNVPESKSTSLGKYVVGKSYRGIFGKAYKLHGLDTTNSNSYKRNIVLHHYSAVPFLEQDYYIVNSHGCPMVNEVFFHRLEKKIDSSKFKILLDIYY